MDNLAILRVFTDKVKTPYVNSIPDLTEKRKSFAPQAEVKLDER
jgi:hypothetical protein